MARFNRNVITDADIATFNDPAKPNPKSLTASPPASSGPGQIVPASSDDYLTKLVKYVPLEIIGFYLFADKLIATNVPSIADRKVWLLILLIATLVLGAAYLRSALSVARLSQILVSLIAVTIYVYNYGGWFGLQSWYKNWYGTLAIGLFAVIVGVLKLPALPTESSTSSTPLLPPAKAAAQ